MSDTPSQKRVIRSLNARTDSAAAKLDHLYRTKLCTLVERQMGVRLGGRKDPEDVVQSALLAVLRRAANPDFHIDCAGQLWDLLAKVTRRKMLNSVARIKAGKRTPIREALGDPDRHPAPSPGPDDVVTAIDLIEETLKGLDEDHAEVLRLLLEGRPEREIAKTLGCCRETVRMIRDRLRGRLNKLLERAER